MPTRLTLDAFLEVVKRSGLVSDERLTGILAGTDVESAEQLAVRLVDAGLLTRWQADKLLQGRHKGLLLGKYRLLRLLGRGGMSYVYLAEHKVMKRQCAIKVLPAASVHDQAAFERFIREAQAVASLDHPNIVRAYDIDEVAPGPDEPGVHFIVMEYVPGRNLREIVDSDGPLEPVVAAEYLKQAADGIHHAHEIGLVHRDIKPGNLLVDDRGVVKILDLGLARLFADAEEDGSVTRDHSQKVLGTADYLSPEQAVDSHEVDPRSDIYSLGCTACFLLTGSPPFPDGPLTQRLLAHQNQAPPDLRERRPDLDPQLAAIIARTLEKQPAQRYQTAQELADALEAWLADRRSLETTAPALPPDPPADRPPQSDQPAVPSAVTDQPEFPDFRAFDPAGTSAVERIEAGDEPVFPGILIDEAPAAAESSAEFRPGFESSADSGGNELPADPSPVSPETMPFLAEQPSVSVTARRQTRSSTRRQTRRRFPWISVLAGAVTVGTVGVVWIGFEQGWLGGGSSDSGSGERVGEDAGLRQNMTVGKGGDFASLQEALDFVQREFAGTTWDQQVIEILPGRYPTRLKLRDDVLDPFPAGVVISGRPGAVLESQDGQPVLDLVDVKGLTIRGLEIDANGALEAVRISGRVIGSRLEQLRIHEFSQTGVRLNRVLCFRGDDRELILDGVVFDGQAGATAVRCDPQPNLESFVTIKSCEFGGALATGVDFGDYCAGNVIRESVFWELDRGVAFTGTDPVLSDTTLANNTFVRCGRAIVVEQHPARYSSKFRVYRNLFVQSQQADLQVLANYLALEFRQVFARPDDFAGNVTTRAAVDEADGHFNLFQRAGRMGVSDPQWVSSQLGTEGFAVPVSAESIQISGDNRPENFGAGARPAPGTHRE